MLIYSVVLVLTLLFLGLSFLVSEKGTRVGALPDHPAPEKEKRPSLLPSLEAERAVLGCARQPHASHCSEHSRQHWPSWDMSLLPWMLTSGFRFLAPILSPSWYLVMARNYNSLVVVPPPLGEFWRRL